MSSPEVKALNNSENRRAAIFAIATSLLLCNGCAPLTPLQAEEREYRNVDFRNKFVDYRSQCIAAGGRMYVDARSKVGRDGIPKRGTYYYCS